MNIEELIEYLENIIEIDNNEINIRAIKSIKILNNREVIINFLPKAEFELYDVERKIEKSMKFLQNNER